MQTILAGFGYLGEKIALLMLREKFSLTVVTRSGRRPEKNVPPDCKFVSCNLAEKSPVLERSDYDAAIFCLAPGNGRRNGESYRQTYCIAQRNFLQDIKAQHYVFISSTAVYPETAGRYDESSAIAHSERAEILLAAEQIALEQKHGCVLRLAGLYSADRPIYRAGAADYEDDKLVHFIHRDDAARAVLHAVTRRLTGIYNVHDGNPQLRSTILHALGDEKVPKELTARRLLDCGKFFASGFQPAFADYFAGIQEVQN